jgi:hypothetical protein
MVQITNHAPHDHQQISISPTTISDKARVLQTDETMLCAPSAPAKEPEFLQILTIGATNNLDSDMILQIAQIPSVQIQILPFYPYFPEIIEESFQGVVTLTR